MFLDECRSDKSIYESVKVVHVSKFAETSSQRKTSPRNLYPALIVNIRQVGS